MFKTRNFLAAALAVAATVALSSCAVGNSDGNSEGSSPSASADAGSAVFNDADVTFAQMMIPHHEQAVQMSDDLLAKDGIDQGIASLAVAIKAAQEPEITQLKDWLTQWNANDSGMSGMGDMGGSDGMMSDGDMTAFQDATGTDAERLFLEQMTVHHQGAITMAQLEIDTGENADAQALAANIISTQQTEISVMAQLLTTL